MKYWTMYWTDTKIEIWLKPGSYAHCSWLMCALLNIINLDVGADPRISSQSNGPAMDSLEGAKLELPPV